MPTTANTRATTRRGDVTGGGWARLGRGPVVGPNRRTELVAGLVLLGGHLEVRGSRLGGYEVVRKECGWWVSSGRCGESDSSDTV